jgi:ectoine hydroxylase-related dioxygenase (phytanoyl-CoA dioxygenase family)
MNEIKTHAVREVHRNEDEDDLLVEEIRNVGYTVIDSGFSQDELQLIREKIDRVYERQLEEIGGEGQLHRINDGNLARCLVGYDDYFLNLAAHPRLVSICTRLLGEHFLLMSQNAIINRPAGEHYQVTWHRDLNYQHFVSSRPLAISALYCVDDFNEETGGTFLLPASHKSEKFPSGDYVLRHERQMSAPAGAVLVFDAMVYHRTGHNRSGRVRRAVNHIFSLPLIKQQISLPRMLGGRFSDDPFLSKFLGYETETADSVSHWREFKLGQAAKSEEEVVSRQ